MIKFSLWLITPDKEIGDRWYRLFTREHLRVEPLPDLSALNRAPQDNWGLALVEVCPKGLSSPADLRTFLNGRKNISVLVFSRPGRISNRDISCFLENGADDFLTTDIDDQVLYSKAKAHIRRLLPSLNMARTLVSSLDGEVEADNTARTVRLGPACGKNRTVDNLTPKEFEILFMLLSAEENVVSRKALMEAIWKERSGHVNVETVDKHVETLRRKLKAYGKNIKTVYGTGYTYKSLSKEAA
jgi:DNA-binding response OmpR family regulator